MTRPRPLPRHLGSSFSTAQALASGVTPRRLRAQDLTAPFRGTRRKATADESPGEEHSDEPYAEERKRRAEHLDAMRLFATVMEPGTFFCGRTAAYAYGAPIKRGERLEIGCFAPRRAPLRHGIRGRKISPHLATVRVHTGLPMTSPASTWAMLATELSARELVIVGDAFVQIPRDRFGVQHPDQALARIDDLRAVVEAGMRPGIKKLCSALTLIHVGSSSPLETEYRLDAESAGLPKPTLDMEIRDEDGRLLGISEFVYEEYRVIVEVEGDHHRSRKQWHRDIKKYQDYEDAGWRVIRVTSVHIKRSTHAVSIVATALRRRGWQGNLRRA